MKIKKITIKGYRSIKAIELNTINDFNIFVGQNNHGKTNIFEALEWFFNGPRKGESLSILRHCLNTTIPIEVCIEFDGLKEAIEKMKNASNAAKFSSIKNEKSILIRRTSENEGKKREIFDIETATWKDPGTGFDKALSDLLPRFEYIDTHKSFEDVSAYKRISPMGIVLSALLADIMEADSNYVEFKKAFDKTFNEEGENSGVRGKMQEIGKDLKARLQKQFPDTEQVNITLSLPVIEDLFKSLNIQVNDGVNTRVCDKGDGMQRAVMLAIMEMYSDFRKKSENGKNNIFFIDEAELHLHPSAQRQLKTVLLELAQNSDQVFINTHSSVFIADDNSHQNIYQVFKTDKQTQAKIVTDREKPHVVFGLLGGSPADLLLPANFLIVEGRSESLLLNKLIEKYYSDKPQIQIVEAKGDVVKAKQTFFAISEMYKPLKNSIYAKRAVLVFDKCEERQKNSFLSTNLIEENEQVFFLPVDSIEKYYPDGWKNCNHMTGEEKIALAKEVANNIAQNIFETQMPIFFKALQKAWEKAYKKE